MPASRRACAITLAPGHARQGPGLPIKTRIVFCLFKVSPPKEQVKVKKYNQQRGLSEIYLNLDLLHLFPVSFFSCLTLNPNLNLTCFIYFLPLSQSSLLHLRHDDALATQDVRSDKRLHPSLSFFFSWRSPSAHGLPGISSRSPGWSTRPAITRDEISEIVDERV